MKFSLLFKLSALVVMIICSPYWFVNLYTFGLQFRISGYNSEPGTIMVLGAGLRGDLPSQILQKRLDVAAQMYHEGKVRNILLSGSNTEETHNEPQAMRRYLVNFKDIPSTRIFMDFGGRRTIDSCWRAKYVFKQEQIYLSTQAFHLGRSVFLCRALGLQTIPVVADNVPRAGRDTIYGIIREVGASWEAGSNLYNNYEPPIQSDGSEEIPI